MSFVCDSHYDFSLFEYLLTYLFWGDSFLADNEAPTVTCPTNKTTNVDSGMAGAIVTWSRSPFAEDVVDATVNADSVVCKDNLDNVTISDGFFQVGKTTVTCRASDISLNEGSCAFVITVTGKYFL